MHIPNELARKSYWWLQHARGRTGIQERLEFLDESQWWPRKKMAAFQLEKLQQVLIHSYDTVPFYRRAMEARGFNPRQFTSPAQLSAIPLLTRTLLLENQEALISSKADRDSLQWNFSSGSTGRRAQFAQDQNFRLWMRAHQLRTYQWCREWKLGEPFVLLWGSEIYWSSKQLADHIDNLFSNRREFNTFRLSRELVRQFVTALARFRPRLVSTYTNAMHLICHEVEQQGIDFPELRAVQGTSEPFPPAFRRRIEKALGCETYDKYGTRETNIVSHESPDHDGMCIQAENVFIEILDDNDEPCPPGSSGRVILTTLNNLSMPLIRYETSDRASFVEGTAGCSIGLPKMSHVAGRQQDLIVTPEGDFIDAYLFSYLIMRFSEIRWFQVVQDTPSALLIRLYSPETVPQQVLDAIRERVCHHTSTLFDLEFEMLSEMPESATGKFRLCMSSISPLGDLERTTTGDIADDL